MSRRKKDKDLDNLVDTLTKENNNLKKKIGKLRKLVSNSNLEIDTEDEDKVVFEEEISKKCAKCGGLLKEVKIMNLLFTICQKCKSRTKILK